MSLPTKARPTKSRRKQLCLMFFCYAFESHSICVLIFMHLCVTLLVLIVFSADPVKLMTRFILPLSENQNQIEKFTLSLLTPL